MDSENSNMKWSNITLPKRSVVPGFLKVSGSDFSWKNKSGTTVTIPLSDVEEAKWLVMGSKGMIELINNNEVIQIDGFKNTDFDTFNQFFATQKIPFKEEKLAAKGWNWASEYTFDKGTLGLKINKQRGFEIPLSDISRSTNNPTGMAKSDVLIELQQDDTQTKEHERLTGIRFWVPNLNGDEAPETTAQEFHQKIQSIAELETDAGSGIIEFQNIDGKIPRGRYTVELFQSFVLFHGKSVDYKILWKNVSRLFQLPKPDKSGIFFVIHFDTPIGQGNTRYSDIVLQFVADLNESQEQAPEETFQLSIRPELLKKLHAQNNAIREKMTGTLHDVIINLFSALSGQSVTLPSNFQSSYQGNAVACSLRTNPGFLYPLNKAFIYVPRPPTHVPFDQIVSIEFARVTAGSTNNTFDLVLNLQSSQVQFTGIHRSEYGGLFELIQSKKIKIKSGVDPKKPSGLPKRKEVIIDEVLDEEEEEEDEDFVAEEEDDDISEEYRSDFSDEEEVEGEEEPKEQKKEKKSKKEKKKKKEKKEKRSAPSDRESVKKVKIEEEEEE